MEHSGFAIAILKIIFTISFLFFVSPLFAQDKVLLSQTIRGKISDASSQLPIEGASVILLSSTKNEGSITLKDGSFRISSVPVGLHSLKISAIGFKEVTLTAVSVNSGKEVILHIELETSVASLKEVVVKSQTDKSRTVNKMTDAGARLISVNETQRFAASFNDPLRVVQSFAGITPAGEEGENLVSIRGNSPFGVQWRLEGIEIPNPNHFAPAASSGGGISIISQQLMGNSDFYTAAFPAEFGNATAGIFDIRLRKGNDEKREYTFQAGILGLDFSSEGPIKKTNKSSYLVNYRYSSLGLLKEIGIDLGEDNTKFQDLSFNISYPTKKAGAFTFFGLGGISDNSSQPTAIRRFGTIGIDNKGVLGVTHTKQLKRNGYVRTVVAMYGLKNELIDELIQNDGTIIYLNDDRYKQSGINISSLLNKRFSSKWHLRTGLVSNNIAFNLKRAERHPPSFIEEKTLESQGSTGSFEGFIQIKHYFSEQISLMGGVHSQYFFLNGKKSLEPRISFKWQPDKKNTLAIAYGRHSQRLPVGIYLSGYKDNFGNFIQPNKDLGFYTADHFLFSYDKLFSAYFHIKTELYYQYLSNVPVNNTEEATFSLLNLSDFFYTLPLYSKGSGKNKGLEVTIEHYLHKNFYFLSTASVYSSTYSTIHGTWFNTKFNRGYAVSFTGGKDFIFGKKKNQNTLGINVRIIYSGGIRDTPIDIPATNASGGQVIYDYTKRNSDQLKSYLRPDVKVSIKTNYKKFTGTFVIEVEDFIDRKNVYKRSYSSFFDSYLYNFSSALIPIIGYKIEF